MSSVNNVQCIDAHAHLNFSQFDLDREQIISQCLKEKIGIVNVGCDYQSSQKAIEIANQYQSGVWATVGIHPTETEKEKFDQQKLAELAQDKKVVAIGEIGLDYYRETNNQAQQIQKECLRQQILLAQELNLPIIFHCRDAHQDLLSIINQFKIKQAEIHCFDGPVEILREYLKLGFFVGFTGMITYSSRLDKVIQETPLDSILIETDCPYLTPVPFRGQRNSPLLLKYIAQKIARIKNIHLEKIYQAALTNTQNLFQI